jgi:hypothetical protein
VLPKAILSLRREALVKPQDLCFCVSYRKLTTFNIPNVAVRKVV